MADDAQRVRWIAYNVPADVPPEYAVAIRTHNGSPTLLTVTNTSVSNGARFFVNAGVYTANNALPANNPSAFEEVRDFQGATMMVSNISTAPAILRVLVVGLVDGPKAS